MEPTDKQLPTRLVLTGFMGAGKTTVGKRLAHALGWPFVDLDEEIVLAQGSSISSIFDSVGEPVFRAIEHRALTTVLRRSPIILALGGGALESEASRKLITDDPATLLIYLEAPLEVLLTRCDEQERSMPEAARRPVLINRDAIAERFLRRQLCYEGAQWRINTATREPADTAADILARLQQLRDGRTSPGEAGAPPEDRI
jgi:shikimate kinase